MAEFLKLDNVCKIFKVGTLLSRVVIPAVWRISLSLPDTPFVFSLVGESGSGKTTLANIILRILKPTSGKIYLYGRNLDEYPKKEFLKRVQPIFQNPFETFNPLKKVELYLFSSAKKFGVDHNVTSRIEKALNTVGLNLEQIRGKYPHEFSGGQLQRVAIARALLVDPDLLVADEPVSMLDASLRISILNLFKELRDKYGKKILYITHDLATAYYISDFMAVMLRGSIMEMGPAEEILNKPLHPYTVLLRESVPDICSETKASVETRMGEIENGSYTQTGCKFLKRCPHAMQICSEEPPHFQVGERKVKCWLYKTSEGGLAYVTG
ncbi:MAG: ABC transporter ATP-binding protein [Thermotoga caldifontis]|uniref:ABC transporter ATP-binding protein n=2 Tax=Thermotoga caldifontis TaxID=1508419 RepID=UPI003C7A2575